MEIAVADDGQGFDLTEKPQGFGLTGMRERVELAGGELDIDSRADRHHDSREAPGAARAAGAGV